MWAKHLVALIKQLIKYWEILSIVSTENVLVDPSTICPDLSIASCQWTYVSQIDHGLNEGIKEVSLATSKSVHNRDSVGARG